LPGGTKIFGGAGWAQADEIPTIPENIPMIRRAIAVDKMCLRMGRMNTIRGRGM
jgi:hypothetical protein